MNKDAYLWSNRHQSREKAKLSPLEIEQIQFEERQNKWNSFKQSVTELERILREGGYIKPCETENDYQEDHQKESLEKQQQEVIK